jgi:hypothetical protein
VRCTTTIPVRIQRPASAPHRSAWPSAAGVAVAARSSRAAARAPATRAAAQRRGRAAHALKKTGRTPALATTPWKTSAPTTRRSKPARRFWVTSMATPSKLRRRPGASYAVTASCAIAARQEPEPDHRRPRGSAAGAAGPAGATTLPRSTMPGGGAPVGPTGTTVRRAQRDLTICAATSCWATSRSLVLVCCERRRNTSNASLALRP